MATKVGKESSPADRRIQTELTKRARRGKIRVRVGDGLKKDAYRVLGIALDCDGVFEIAIGLKK